MSQKFMFHATYRAYLSSIMEHGLGGVSHKNWDCSTGDVCLAPYPEEAESYAEVAPEMGLVPLSVEASGIIILCVDVKGLELKVDPNIDDEDIECKVFCGVIPPARITPLKQADDYLYSIFDHLLLDLRSCTNA